MILSRHDDPYERHHLGLSRWSDDPPPERKSLYWFWTLLSRIADPSHGYPRRSVLL